MSDVCVHCGEELNLFERTRCECWMCRDKISDSYTDDHLEEDE